MSRTLLDEQVALPSLRWFVGILPLALLLIRGSAVAQSLPAPSIQGISPVVGSTAAGTVVTINGANFQTGATVRFGKNNGTAVNVVSAAVIQATTPPSATQGTVGVTVTNPDGQSATLSTSYTYHYPPTIQSVGPTNGPASGKTTVTITGQYFRSGAVVQFGSISSPTVTFVSGTSLKAVTPAEPSGVVGITVINPDGLTATLPSAFAFNPGPSITSLLPTGGSTNGGTVVTISGANFIGLPRVAFGSVQSTSVTLVSSIELQAVAPPQAAGTVGVVVTNPDGQKSSLPLSYTYALLPSLQSISPNSGLSNGGLTVVLTGTTFRLGAAVTFGGTSSPSVTFVSSTELKAVTPAHPAAVVDVTVTNPDGQTATLPAAFTYSGPTITSVSPNVGPTSGQTNVTIRGSNYVKGATVSFGGTSASKVSFVSGGQLNIVTPANPAGPVAVTVTNPSGDTATLPSGYTYVPGPAIYNISPNSGTPAGGTTVTISGANLSTVSSVLFGGIPATIKSASAASLQVTTPPFGGGAATVDVTVQDPANGNVSAHNGFQYTVLITTQGLDDGYPGIPYQVTLSAEGGAPPYQWSVAAGSLPAGLNLGASTGVLSGAPSGAYGTYTVTILAQDSSSPSQSYSKSLTFNILYGFRTTPVPSTFFGMILYNQTTWPTAPVGALGKGLATSWPFIEQVKGTFNWTVLDQYVADAQAHGVTLYWTNANVPPWAAADPTTCSYYSGTAISACTSTVANIRDFDNFMTALVQRYQGKIQMYELWSEPNVSNVYTGTIADLVTLTQHAYADISANDPNATIISPSPTSAQYLQQYLSAGGPAGSAIAIHGYPNVGVADVPESIVGFKSVNPKLTALQFGLQTLPIIDTEGSWGGSASNRDADFRAAFIARSFLLHWSVGIPRFYWYGWDSPDWGTLWTPSGGITPAGIAYEQVYNWMLGASMPQPCSQNGGTTYNAIYTCTLTRSNGYIAQAVWDTTQTCSNGVCTTSTYTPPPGLIHYRDLAGNIFPISSGQTVQIGAKPILLEK